MGLFDSMLELVRGAGVDESSVAGVRNPEELRARLQDELRRARIERQGFEKEMDEIDTEIARLEGELQRPGIGPARKGQIHRDIDNQEEEGTGVQKLIEALRKKERMLIGAKNAIDQMHAESLVSLNEKSLDELATLIQEKSRARAAADLASGSVERAAARWTDDSETRKRHEEREKRLRQSRASAEPAAGNEIREFE